MRYSALISIEDADTGHLLHQELGCRIVVIDGSRPSGLNTRCSALEENWGGSLIDATGTFAHIDAIPKQTVNIGFGPSCCFTSTRW